jgi:23S rRNA pseudouridine955/2504/2580 synthase
MMNRQIAKRVTILYEDDDCLILDKPAGLAVQGGAGVKTSLDAILTSASQTPTHPLLVHRLDKDTSGIILTAKNQKAAAYYSAKIASKEIHKHYIAVCSLSDDFCLPDEGAINSTIMIKGQEKSALTNYKIIKRSSLHVKTEDKGKTIAPPTSHIEEKNPCEFALFEIELGSGRMHQIRRHLAENGAPIIGDEKYGDWTLNKKLRKEAGLKKMLLHASRLVFATECGTLLDITAPLPEYFSFCMF